MLRAELSRGLVALLLLGVLLGLHPRAAAAAPRAPSRVQLVLVDVPGGDPLLPARIRTLFPRGTQVGSRRSATLDAALVLRPSESETLWVWIHFRGSNRVRIYLTAADAGAVRYLFRDVTLDRGLDEVGGESLAQIVHSAAEALWSGEQQVTSEDVALTLASSASSASASDPAPALAGAPAAEHAAAPVRAAPSVAPTGQARASDDEPSDQPAERATARVPTTGIGLGASFGAHFDAAAGWLSKPGAFVIARYGKFSVRIDGSVVLPAELQLPPVEVRLTGADGGLRAGWQALGSGQVRVRLDAGIGVWAGRWRATIVASEPAAHADPGRAFLRPYAVTSIGLEWFNGPVWLAARAELRGRFSRVEYAVAGQSALATSGYLEPGGVLEFGVLVERGSR